MAKKKSIEDVRVLPEVVVTAPRGNINRGTIAPIDFSSHLTDYTNYLPYRIPSVTRVIKRNPNEVNVVNADVSDFDNLTTDAFIPNNQIVKNILNGYQISLPSLAKLKKDAREKQIDFTKFSLGGRVKAKNGTKVENDDEDDKAKSWVKNWYKGRRKQIANNMETSISSNPEERESDIDSVIAGINEHIDNSVVSSTKVPKGTAVKGGVTHKGNKSVKVYEENASESTRVHENSHIADYATDRNFSRETDSRIKTPNGDEYYDKGSEKYARMMELRYQMKLKPTDVVTKEMLNANRQHIKDLQMDYDDDQLLDAMNNVASNENYKPNDNMAKCGKRLIARGGKRVDWSNFKLPSGRVVYPKYMQQLEDSLVARGIPVEQQNAILGTVAEESGGDYKKVDKSKEYRGLLQYSTGRMADKYLRGTMGDQIHFMLEDIYYPKTNDAWHHGGKGSGYMRAENAKAAFEGATTTEAANHALNYGYVRPYKDPEDRKAAVKNRAKAAEAVSRARKPFGGRFTLE